MRGLRAQETGETAHVAFSTVEEPRSMATNLSCFDDGGDVDGDNGNEERSVENRRSVVVMAG